MAMRMLFHIMADSFDVAIMSEVLEHWVSVSWLIP
jgi:hypothetical protein